MARHVRTCVMAALLAAGVPAQSQQPSPASPAFAPSDLSENGVRAMAANCAPCHGTQGRPAKGSIVAPLAGRPAAELVDLMAQYREGRRRATLMHQIAKGYTDAEIAAIARYFSKQSREAGP